MAHLKKVKDMTNTNLISQNDSHLTINDLQVIEDEPRIKDIVLGERLGFGRAVKVKDIIERNISELEQYGSCPQTGETAKVGCVTRKIKTYYLNEAQALLLCMFSRTAQAAQVRKELIDVYMAYRRQQLPSLDVKSLAAAVASELKMQLAAPRKVSYIPEILQDFCRDQVLRMDIVTPFADIYQIFELYCLSHDKPTPSANRLSRYLQSEGFQKTTDRRGNKAFVLGIKEYDKSRFRYVFAPIDGYNGAGIYRCKNGECYQIIDKISGKGASYSWYNLRTGQAEGPFGTCNIEDFNDRIVSKMTSKIEIMGIDGAALYLGSAK